MYELGIHKYPNLLNRDFNADRPNQKWVTDISYILKLESYDEARKLIDEYIYFYNHQRIQLKTKLTPYEKRCQYVA